MNKSKNNSLKEKNGITLIALVVTIIILIILAGVSINLVLGENGIIIKAKESKQENEKATEKEYLILAVSEAQLTINEKLDVTNLQKILDKQLGTGKVVISSNRDNTFTASFIETKRDYNITANGIEEGINWNIAMQNAKIPIEQTNKNVIGLGTDGKTVNMDYWEYALLEDGTYGLNTKSYLLEGGSDTVGYKGGFTEDGQILGTVPQYISEDEGSTFIKVTNMNYTLGSMPQLKIAPKIPSTVIDMSSTFWGCDNLVIAPQIPYGVTNMGSTFYGCSKLTIAPEIPNTVKNIRAIFMNTSITKAPDIPNSVKNMIDSFYGTMIENVPSIPNGVEVIDGVFRNCTNLKNINLTIPNTVISMQKSFNGCINLSGTITIDASLTGSTQSGEYKYGVGQSPYWECFYNASTAENTNLIIKGNTSNSILEEMVTDAITSNPDSKITLKI